MKFKLAKRILSTFLTFYTFILFFSCSQKKSELTNATVMLCSSDPQCINTIDTNGNRYKFIKVVSELKGESLQLEHFSIDDAEYHTCFCGDHGSKSLKLLNYIPYEFSDSILQIGVQFFSPSVLNVEYEFTVELYDLTGKLIGSIPKKSGKVTSLASSVIIEDKVKINKQDLLPLQLDSNNNSISQR